MSCRIRRHGQPFGAAASFLLCLRPRSPVSRDDGRIRGTKTPPQELPGRRSNLIRYKIILCACCGRGIC
ncbi:hypothetical protein EVAR_51011_1 [Eumeta japonica]|uniref:Uncharacterized protein n=1 Tax=Eumeta variegata TaxID=151549 RepID=A0A4C1Y7C1_EUMVA|nr:hypothetical protein EVAR_51011_1 [Eumeta japonica]